VPAGDGRQGRGDVAVGVVLRRQGEHESGDKPLLGREFLAVAIGQGERQPPIRWASS
jgi:hypothetical protein